MARRTAATALLLTLACMRCAASADPSATSAYVDSRDVTVADKAAGVRIEACAVAKQGGEVDRDAAREELLGAMGDTNFVLEMLQEAETPKEVSQKTKDKMTIPFIIATGYPLILALLVAVFYLFCCWSACPCCRCCRCCATKETRPRGRLFKLMLFLALGAALAGILAGGITTMKGFDTSNAGFESLACSAAEVLDTTLSGGKDPYFIGMLPILKTIETLDEQLDDGSPMLNDLGNIMDKTEPIEQAVQLASKVMSLLAQVLEMPGNVNPTAAPMGDLMHRCELCKELAHPLLEASRALGAGVGSALADARASVRDALTPEDRKDLQSTLRQSVDPLVEFKKSMRDAFSGFVEPGFFESLRQVFETQAKPILLGFFFWALLLLVFACLAGVCLLTRETKANGQYSNAPHRLACSVWGCAAFQIVLGLIVGGALATAFVPLSGLCLVMDGLDSTMFNSISGGIGMNMSGDNGLMMSDMLDKCLTTGNTSLNANLMDIVFVRDENNTKVTTREKIMGQLTAPLSQAFGLLEQAMGNGSSIPQISSNDQIVKIRNLLGQNPMSAFVLPITQKLADDVTISPMLSDADLKVGAATSMQCADFTPVGELGPFTNQSITGLTTFVDEFKTKGVPLGAADGCLEKVTCSPGASQQACEGGNKLVDLKLALKNVAKFNCKFFVDSSGAACDPTSMKVVDSKWVDDCVFTQADGTRKMFIQAKQCSLAEFDAYVKAYDPLLQKVFQRLDSEAGMFASDISADLNDLVDTYLVAPTMKIIDGVTCGFMPKFYRGIVDGLCFQGVVGFRMIAKSYVVLSVFVLFLALVMHVFWRFAIGNVNADVEERKATM